MFTLFYRNTRLLILTIILIFVWGISSYLALPRLEDPELVSRNASVKTFFPGADAARIEALITDNIEDQFTEIEEIKDYNSTSSSGSSIIIIELKDSVQKSEVDGIWSRVQNQIDEIEPELPPGASEPELEKIKIKAYALITALTWTQDDRPNYAILNRQAEVLKDRIQGIAGTEEVELYGDRTEEISVEIDSTAIASYNLTVSDIASQIRQSDSKVAAGLLRSDEQDLSFEVAGELDTLERIRNIPLNSSQGQFIRLQDVAKVTKGIKTPPDEISVVGDRPAVTIAVHVESGTRLDLWANEAEKVLAAYRAELPSALELKTILAQSNYVEDRLNGLMLNLLLGGGLVFLVTLLMMGWRSAIIVGTSLPLSILMVFGWMNVMGIPLHQMSITGLIVALGILIDNAIVMVDEVTSHLRSGVKRIDAIRNSVKHLAVPLLSSTITTVLAFLPIALLPGPTGEFVGTIALSVILAVSSSLFLALAVMPTLTVKLARTNKSVKMYHNTSLRGSWWQTGISIPFLTRWYNKTLKWTTARPVLGIGLALILPITGFIQAGSLEQQFFPAADRDQLQIQLELPASSSIVQTRKITEQIRDRLLTFDSITDVHWFIGRSVPRFYYNVSTSREREPEYAQAIVQLEGLATSDLAAKLQTELDSSFPTARIIVRQLEQGPPFDAPVEMRIYGSDLDTLQQLGEEARSLLLGVANITHTRASLAEATPQLELEANEEEVRLAGLNRRAIAEQLDANLEGTIGGSILESTEELPVRVRLSAPNRANLNDITSLDLLAPGTGEGVQNVPLSSLGKVTLKPELNTISRYNGQKVNTIQGFLTPGVLPDKALSDFKQQLADANWQLPNGYSYEFGGEAEQKSNAIGGLVSTVGVIGVLMVATLVLSLGSFRLAAVIGVVAMASFGLGLFAIWIFSYPFGFNPIIGTVGLIGVAINDSIVVLAAIQQHPVAKTGNRKAIREVVLRSTRHVIATTLTTAVGFVPLLLGGGEFWPPLAIAIAGGVIGATLLALYLIPAAYLIVVNNKRKISPTYSQSLKTFS
ncbi:efflux RND transporter permease subunit [Pleurocapsales cyanobacterium LEGE 10410]|nr:efflux RND transporter permease subunit [Pleurocapsales cyanobacterium LEGE 10410]